MLSTRAFFSFSLILPVLGGLLGLIVPATRLLLGGLIIGAIPYAVFSVALVFLITRASTKRHLATLSLVTPLLFALVVAAFILVVGSSSGTRDLPLREIAGQLLPFVEYGLLFGYFYTALAWCLWLLGRRFGLVHDEFAT
jgi:hypothetical protein